MSEINIEFLHPTDGRIITVTIDNSLTINETIKELLNVGFLNPNPDGYGLAKRDSRPRMLAPLSTFAEENIRTGDVILIIPSTDAG